MLRAPVVPVVPTTCCTCCTPIMPVAFRYEVMLSCWNETVPQRPTFSELQTKFDRMLSAEGNNPYIDFSINPNSLCYQVADVDEGDISDDHLQVAPPGANRRSIISGRARLGSELSANVSCSSSRQVSPASSIDLEKPGLAPPTPEKALTVNTGGSGRRPHSMVLPRARSPQRVDEDRLVWHRVYRPQ